MSAVSYQDVELAIQSLLKEKKAVTLANLRFQLGNRGSMTTLSKYLQQWKSSKYLDDVPTVDVHEPAPDPIFTAVQSVWQQMVGHGEQQIVKVQEEFEVKETEYLDKIKKLEAESVLAKENLELLEQNLKELKKQLSESLHRNEKLVFDNHGLNQNLKNYADFSLMIQQNLQDVRKMLSTRYEEELILLKQSHEEIIERFKTENSNLKELLEQQRHEHLLVQDKLKVEHQQLFEKYQRNITQIELQNIWKEFNIEVKHTLEQNQSIFNKFIEVSKESYNKYLRRPLERSYEGYNLVLLNKTTSSTNIK